MGSSGGQAMHTCLSKQLKNRSRHHLASARDLSNVAEHCLLTASSHNLAPHQPASAPVLDPELNQHPGITAQWKELDAKTCHTLTKDLQQQCNACMWNDAQRSA